MPDVALEATQLQFVVRYRHQHCWPAPSSWGGLKTASTQRNFA